MFRLFARLVPALASSILVASGCLLAAPGLAEDCSEIHNGRVPNPYGNEIRVVPESAGAPVETSAIEDAVTMWSTVCAASLPRFSPRGNIVMRLRFHAGPNDIPDCGDGCACTIANTLPAPGEGQYLASAITHVFERHRDGRGDCRAHRSETLAHEIGHVLGFRHPEDPYDARCAGLIMSFSPNRSVTPGDCRAMASLWRLPPQAPPNLEHLRWLPRSPGAAAASQPRAAEAEGTLRDPRDDP